MEREVERSHFIMKSESTVIIIFSYAMKNVYTRVEVWVKSMPLPQPLIFTFGSLELIIANVYRQSSSIFSSTFIL